MPKDKPELPERPESGPMQFGDDWPGLFLRGDEALFAAQALRFAIDGDNSLFVKIQLEGLLETFEAVRVPCQPTQLKTFHKCKETP